jgi:magnesium transporter
MAKAEDLSLAFIELHPVDAARVLERLAPQHVAALLAEAPSRLAAPVLRAMLPLHAARCFEVLPDGRVTELLRAMGPQAGVNVLHYVPDPRRNVLLGQLPTALSVAFRLLLGYPDDAVGAWMDPRVLALPADTSADAALKRLRDTQALKDNRIFVIDPDQRLLGQSELPDILHAAADSPLSRVMRKVAHKLPARTTIRAVADHAGWDECQVLPVVEGGDRFVGALDRGVLLRALRRGQTVGESGVHDDALTSLAGEYWAGVSSLIQMMVALLPVGRQQATGESHEHQR